MNKSQKAFFDAFGKMVVETDSTDFDVDSLCNRAGYGRQTFYYNFKSKQEFLSESIKHYLLRQIVPMGKLDKENAKRFLSSFIDTFRNKHLQLRNLIFSDDYREFIFDFLKDFYISKIILLVPEVGKETTTLLSGALFAIALKASLDETVVFDIDVLARELLAIIRIGSKKTRKNKNKIASKLYS